VYPDPKSREIFPINGNDIIGDADWQGSSPKRLNRGEFLEICGIQFSMNDLEEQHLQQISLRVLLEGYSLNPARAS
jgi:hypothetical protein